MGRRRFVDRRRTTSVRVVVTVGEHVPHSHIEESEDEMVDEFDAPDDESTADADEPDLDVPEIDVRGARFTTLVESAAR